MKKWYLKLFARICVLVILGSLLYVGLLSASLSYHTESLQRHTEQAIEIMSAETWYPSFYFENDTGFLRQNTRIDNYSDEIIVKRVGMKSDNPLYDAMYMQDYERYWHGYVVLLRPLLSLFDYFTLRRLMQAVFWILLALTAQQLSRRFHSLFGMAFLLAMGVLNTHIVPMSPHYFACFLLALLAANYMFYYEYKGKLSEKRFLYLLAIVGSLTSFLDLLAVPLITFGLPMLLYLLFCAKDKTYRLFALLFRSSVAWSIGYCLNWIMKWFFASLITGEDEFGWAITYSGIRIGKSEVFPTTQFNAIGQNFAALFSVLGVIYLLCCFCLIVLSLVRKQKANLPLVWILSLLSIAPYAWYFALGNHSTVHTWFTYRTQLISLLCWFAIPYALCDFDLKKLFSRAALQ